ncbi:MAG: isoleucine--tRNA ligase [Candidatus Atabeyarchaeum deiterrae]
MAVKEIPKQLSLRELEQRTLEEWRVNKIYEKAKEKLKGKPRFNFIDGPPYTTGSIHLGTAWNKIMKDIVLRFKRMRGFEVNDTPGYDMHGLPIEVKVEQELNIKSKKEIETNVVKFVEKCREFALSNLDTMSQQFSELGVWMDWKKPYMTLSDSYIEGIWKTIKLAYDRGYVYRGVKVLEVCPRCETALARHEHEYHTVTDVSIFVKFKIKSRPNEFLLVWTTTPWTLPANLAVMVHPDFEYVKAKVGTEVWVIAKAMATTLLQGVFEKNFEVLEEFKGMDLEGLKYEHPLVQEVPIQAELDKKYKKAHTVVLSADYVTLEQGTGLVHCAPGHGPEDFEVGKQNGLPPFSPLDVSKFSSEGGKYAGMFPKKADELIINDLEHKGLLVYKGTIEHEYAHCWRCKSPLLFQATSQWFIKVVSLKDEMHKMNSETSWVPDWAGHQWFKNWIDGLQDWCISRQRYWGAPLPMWICDKCGHVEVLGSKQELVAKSGKTPKELHRPWVDEATWKCEQCHGKGTKRRISDVLDVWLDSGSCIWATLPVTTGMADYDDWKELDFIIEGKEQIRGWFNSLMCSSMVAYGRWPYKSVYMHGFMCDEQGREMHKSLGNYIEPSEVIPKHGVESYRFYVSKSAPPGEDIRFNWKDVADTERFLNITWNVYVFASTFMAEAGFNPGKVRSTKVQLLPEDKWILSRTNSVVKQITNELDGYQIPTVTRLLQDLIVKDLSRWYIRLIRARTWVTTSGPSKTAALNTLFNVLEKLTYILAPITPILAEALYQSLVRPTMANPPESVHLCEWPKHSEELINTDLEAKMDHVREIVEGTLAIRQEAKVKLRWPCRRLVIVPKEKEWVDIRELLEVVRDQASVKEVHILSKLLAKDKTEDLREKETSTCTIYLDVSTTEELESERLAKDFTRQVQSLRKKYGYIVTDKIELVVASKDKQILEGLEKQEQQIKSKIGAVKIEGLGEMPEELKDYDAKGEFKYQDEKIQVAFRRKKT